MIQPEVMPTFSCFPSSGYAVKAVGSGAKVASIGKSGVALGGNFRLTAHPPFVIAQSSAGFRGHFCPKHIDALGLAFGSVSDG